MEKEVEELLEQLKFGDDFKYDIRDKYKDNAIEVEEGGAERWDDLCNDGSYLFFRISKYNLKSYRVKDALYIGKGRYLSKVNMRFGYKGGRSHNFVDVIGATHKNLGIKPYLFKTPLEAAAFYFVYKNYVKKVKKVSRFDQKGLKEMYQIRNELNNFLS